MLLSEESGARQSFFMANVCWQQTSNDKISPIIKKK